MDMDIFHCRVYFSGKVQGIGFRYECMKIAREFEVCGYVENLADGRVLLEVEGNESEVKKYVAEINDQMEIFIKTADEKFQRRAAQYKAFLLK